MRSRRDSTRRQTRRRPTGGWEPYADQVDAGSIYTCGCGGTVYQLARGDGYKCAGCGTRQLTGPRREARRPHRGIDARWCECVDCGAVDSARVVRADVLECTECGGRSIVARSAKPSWLLSSAAPALKWTPVPRNLASVVRESVDPNGRAPDVRALVYYLASWAFAKDGAHRRTVADVAALLGWSHARTKAARRRCAALRYRGAPLITTSRSGNTWTTRLHGAAALSRMPARVWGSRVSPGAIVYYAQISVWAGTWTGESWWSLERTAAELGWTKRATRSRRGELNRAQLTRSFRVARHLTWHVRVAGWRDTRSASTRGPRRGSPPSKTLEGVTSAERPGGASTLARGFGGARRPQLQDVGAAGERSDRDTLARASARADGGSFATLNNNSRTAVKSTRAPAQDLHRTMMLAVAQAISRPDPAAWTLHSSSDGLEIRSARPHPPHVLEAVRERMETVCALTGHGDRRVVVTCR